jgi:signal peptidase I
VALNKEQSFMTQSNNTPASQAPEEDTKKKTDTPGAEPVKRKSKFREYAEAIVIAIIIALFIRTFIVHPFKIPSGSMLPTLEIGDQIMVNKFIYGIKIPYFRNTIIPGSSPQRGDIIVFVYPDDRSKDFIKRVIATGGEQIEIRNKKILIDGKPFEDTYGIHTDEVILPGSLRPRDNMDPLVVPDNSLFVLGDNRDDSLDSRFWGVVEERDVVGKAFIIYWSWDGNILRPRWERIFSLLK